MKSKEISSWGWRDKSRLTFTCRHCAGGGPSQVGHDCAELAVPRGCAATSSVLHQTLDLPDSWVLFPALCNLGRGSAVPRASVSPSITWGCCSEAQGIDSCSPQPCTKDSRSPMPVPVTQEVAAPRARHSHSFAVHKWHQCKKGGQHGADADRDAAMGWGGDARAPQLQ